MSGFFTSVITIDGNTMVAAGHPPFMVLPASEGAEESQLWIVTGRDGGNCVAFKDGIRAVFGSDDAANVLCRELNVRAAR